MGKLDKLLEQAVEFAPRLAAGAIMFLAFWLGGIIVQKIVSRAERNIEPGKQDVMNLIGQTAKIGLIILGIITGLGTIGINVSAMVAGLGLTGFALGFAFRDSLSNLPAGALILTCHPFHRSDHIEVMGLAGTVTEINLR